MTTREDSPAAGASGRSSPARPEGPIRVLRVVARLIGGPAYHVSLLSAGLDPERYETLLVHGAGGRHEDTLDEVADAYGVRRLVVHTLGPELRPDRDLRALGELVRIVRDYRPHIVHTHTAKAGMLGRSAVRLARGRRPLVLHTYHGHVLEGYFGAAATRTFRLMERRLARTSDRLIGVSNATVNDLVRLRVAPRERFSVVPVGLDLERFASAPRSSGAAFRREIGAGESEVVVVFAGRLVPIKRLDLLLDGFARARRDLAQLRLVLVGSGECLPALEDQTRKLGISDAVHFLGHRTDIETILSGSDIAALTSANEGTPVFLIEAAASSVPAVATDVGGVSEVIGDEMGILVPNGSAAALGDAMAQLASEPQRRREMGAQAQARVLNRFSADRLLADVEGLYDELLAERAATDLAER